MSNVIIPLYVCENHGTFCFAFSPDEVRNDGLEMELLTKGKLAEIKDRIGLLRISLHDTFAEARAVSDTVSELQLDEVTSISDRIKGGAGVCLTVFPQGDCGVNVFDKRRPAGANIDETFILSWNKTEDGFKAASSRPVSSNRTSDALVNIVAETANGDGDFVQEVQAGLEAIPGAYVEFVTESVSGVMSTFDNILPEELEDHHIALIQEAIREAASSWGINYDSIYEVINDNILIKLENKGLLHREGPEEDLGPS